LLNPPNSAVQLVLFITAVAAVGFAFMLARRYRKMATADIKRAAPSSAVQGGWALFVLLAGVAGVAEPVLACRMFLRAYLVRAWCLRASRKSSRSSQTPISDSETPH
jgi:hypothetical protein